MSLRDYQIILFNVPRDVRAHFNYESRSVCSLFARLVGPVKVPRGNKVNLEVVDKVENHGVRNVLDALTLQLAIDLTSYWDLSGNDRKKVHASILRMGIQRLIELEGWSAEPFLGAFERMEALRYKNAWKSKLGKWNRRRRYRADLLCEHDIDAFSAHIVVTDRGGNVIVNEEAVREIPSEFIFVPLLGKLSWTDDTSVSLLSKKGQRVAQVSFSESS